MHYFSHGSVSQYFVVIKENCFTVALWYNLEDSNPKAFAFQIMYLGKLKYRIFIQKEREIGII